MTESQRDYLADLAAKKGVILENTDDVSAAWASNKIEELKAMPDLVFDEVTPEIDRSIDKKIDSINFELSKWTFQA